MFLSLKNDRFQKNLKRSIHIDGAAKFLAMFIQDLTVSEPLDKENFSFIIQ